MKAREFDLAAAETTIDAIVRNPDAPVVDMTPYSFVTLPALALLVSYLMERAKAATRVPVRWFPSAHPEVNQYIFRMRPFALMSTMRHEAVLNQVLFASHEPAVAGLFELDAERLPYFPFRFISPPSSEIARREFDGHCGAFIEDLRRGFEGVLRPEIGFDRRMQTDFLHAVREIVENVYAHSESSGAITIQTTRSAIFICLTDLGIGMRRSLEPYRERVKIPPKEWTDAVAIRKAFEFGVTCTLKGRGTGLPDMQKFIRSRGGTVVCRSGSARVTFGQKRPSVRGVTTLPGVQLFLHIPVKVGSTNRGNV